MESLPTPAQQTLRRDGLLEYGNMRSGPNQSTIENRADISNQAINQIFHGHQYINETNSENDLAKERIKCLNQLFRVDPTETKENIKARKGSQAPGTCEWFLRTPEFATWRNSDKPADSLFWLSGHPGTGKSTIAIFLADQLEKEFSTCAERTLIYFFCEANTDAQNTASTILRGLVYHLIRQHEYLADRYLLPQYRIQRSNLFASVSSLWRIFSSMVRDKEVGQVYCILDALDECDDDSREILLQYLEQSYSQVDSADNLPKARIFITSRPYQDITDHLSGVCGKDIRTFKELQGDISILIARKVSELKVRKRYTLTMQMKVTKILEDRAEGIFLWIGLACKQLMKTRAIDALAVLNQLPIGLDKIYQKLLQMALEDDMRNARIVKQILSFVALSRTPVTLTQLAFACGLCEDEDKDERDRYMYDYIDMCRSMVVIDNGLVRLLHRSVEEFIFESAAEHFPSRAQIHADIAHRCVNYLLHNISGFQPRQIYDSTFLEYAAMFWPVHAHFAESHYRVQEEHFEFFRLVSEKREMWLNVLSALGENIPLGFSIFHVAARWGIFPLIEHAKSPDFFAGWNVQKSEQSLLSAFSALFEGYSCNPLEEAAAFKDTSSLRGLLRLRVGEINGELRMVDTVTIDKAHYYQFPLTTDVLVSAIRNTDASCEMLEILSEVRPLEFHVNDTLLAEAAKSPKSGMRMMHTLLVTCPQSATINEVILLAALSNGRNNMKIIKALLDIPSVKVEDWQALQYIVLAKCDADVITSFWRLSELDLNITKMTMSALRENPHDIQPVMSYILDLPEQSFDVCVELAKEAAQSFDITTVHKILRLCRIDTDQDLIACAAANTQCGDELVAELLRQDGEIAITAKILIAAVGNVKRADKILKVLFDFSNESLYFNAEVLEAAMNNLELRQELFDMIRDHDSCELNIGESVFLAAANNPPPPQVIDCLMMQQRHPYTMLMGLARTLVVCKMHERLSEVLQRQDISIEFTPELMRIAAGHLGQHLLELLIERCPRQIYERTELLVDAAAAGNYGVVKMLLSNDAYQAHPGSYPQALINAAQNGHIPIVQSLVDHGIPVNARAGVYCTALQAASFEGHHSMVQFLLDCGADVDATGGEYGTALQAASWKGNVQVVKTLLSFQADVNVTGGVFGNALQAAARNGSIEVVRLLLDAEADIDAQGGRHRSALQAATCIKGDQLLRLLIDRGADVNATQDPHAFIVLTVDKGDTQLIHRLLSEDMADDLSDQNLLSHVPLCQSEPIQVANYFLRHNSDVNSIDEYGRTCLHGAASKSLDLCRLLHHAGASINAQDKAGMSVLYYAAYHGQTDVVKWLLDLGASTQDREQQGWTPLHAASTISLKIMRLLYNAGADINAVTCTGFSCLHIASINGQLDIVKWLLSHGVDTNQADTTAGRRCV